MFSSTSSRSLQRASSTCAQCGRLRLQPDGNSRANLLTRSLSASASPQQKGWPIEAQPKARSLPENLTAPFSLQPAVVDEAYKNAAKRRFPVKAEWRHTLERARAELPALAEEVARLKKMLSKNPHNASSSDHAGEVQDRDSLKQILREATAEHDDLRSASLELRLRFPNATHVDVPIGPEMNAQVVGFGDPLDLLPRELKDALKNPESLPCALGTFPPSPPADANKAHTKAAAQLTQHPLFPSSSALDQASGALTTGASFPFLLGPLASLSHALSSYALQICTRHGFMVVRTPDVIKADLARRCGFMPRDEGEASQTYFVSAHRDGGSGSEGLHSPDLCLAGTAEIPLAGLCADRTFFLPSKKGNSGTVLPLKLCALGSAFRAEAGARGADTKGLYRVHQFDKVEMFVVAPSKEVVVGAQDAVSVAKPAPFAAEDADMSYLEELRSIQEEIITGLGLPFRILDMPTEELGASACRKYDIEAWMPGRGSWGEISSASHCTTFQSRRLNIRYRRSPGSQSKLEYAHTLNATAAAMPRLIVALLENFGVMRSDDGQVRLRLPCVLKPYWLGLDTDVQWVSDDKLQS
ncbi:Serine--tRNA ligase, mitochondrial [Tilletia horrida]|uniref:serine--tRNA ligase n=1 Tax=Tilletia horrida TaxID=155126 RepID=A0AAN6GRK7_9BASI|nr:Serine--tRNA ligase, mitochondrial [Tilletia horrida]